MAVYTRYSKVIDAQGKSLSVRKALALINEILDEVLAEQEGDFDADTRWALAWFEQSGFAEGEYGVAETLSTAKDTSVEGMVGSGILASSRGKVRLLRPAELPEDWDPQTDRRTNTGRWSTTWSGLWRKMVNLGRLNWLPSWAPRQKPPASCVTACTPSASAKNAPPKHYPTTPWCRAGPRSCAWPVKSARPAPTQDRLF